MMKLYPHTVTSVVHFKTKTYHQRLVGVDCSALLCLHVTNCTLEWYTKELIMLCNVQKYRGVVRY